MLGLLGLMLAARPAVAQEDIDAIKTTTGTTQFRGTISAISATEVTIQARAIGVKTIPANEIEWLTLAKSPDEVRLAQADFNRANYDAADRRLKKIEKDKLDEPLVKAQFEYLQALTAARLAQGGQGELLDAAKLLLGYIKGYPTSYGYYPANELLGDLLVAMGKYPQAEVYYKELAKAPWPEYKMRAAIASGRTQLAQNNFSEAYKTFEGALTLAGSGARGTEGQVIAATLGKAQALALGGKVPDGLKLAEEVQGKASTEDSDLQARVYNTLGFCYERANRDKDALLAYLHVDLLYPTLPDAHAEALANLINLWTKLGRPDRANQARTTLQTKYPGSRWNPKKG
jgi:tetratricopeptide (TPR) repeat protein